MIKQLTLLLALLLSFTVGAQKDTREIEQFISELDDKIPKLLNDFIVPGTAIAIIENGEIILQKGYGYSNIDKGVKVSNTTGFNIGSISKTVAAWGVMKLVQEGKIDLDAPAEMYLTRWHLPKSEFDSDKVTIRRLLSHTAGLSLHGYPGWSSKDNLPTIEESLNGKNNGPGRVEIIMEPGTKWKYSGGGFSILQLIIEEVTKQRFEDYMQTEILNPLGMTNSSYTINEKILKSSSLEHNNFGEVIDFELFTAQAAAGLHTTIEDFTKFARASLYTYKNNNQQILSASNLQQMMEPAQASNGSYGLGYGIESINGTSITLVGHGGANSGWHAFLRLNPVTNDGFIMITNGGAGHNIYRQVYCDWIYWKTGESMGNRCNIVPSIANKLKTIIETEGIDKIQSQYLELKKNETNGYNFSEDQLNYLGYHYLGKDKVDYAISIFKINVDAFPKSSNVYDSYGEALLKNGDKEKAIENYKKSVELNPGNEGGIKVLKELGINTDELFKEIIIDDTILESYIGKYELSPEFVITVSKDGSQLKAKPTGEEEFEIYPKSKNVFYLKVVEAQITFNKSEDGTVVSMTLLQRGQETTGLKLKD
ncbi:CubicO group peptidase (beta-lactamase class C family) [Flavobacteriaceae bacterium MAR_2010_72]|nr:CubicO group peptidase (beta-lactamase class C family) [Flavobacteriaceae bacterium MAR_2010_72]TVZ59216.1 CubicO group peptidase (beta-lactamase class C family) [Flavobacteriaceae bacterium MAR_2010_105]